MSAKGVGAGAAVTGSALRHLWKLAHSVMHVPEMARYYIMRMQEKAREEGVVLSDEVQSRFCPRCASLLVPGVSCRVRLITKAKRKERRGKTLNQMCYTCGHCKHSQFFGGTRVAFKARRKQEQSHAKQQHTTKRKQLLDAARASSVAPKKLRPHPKAVGAPSLKNNLFFNFQCQDHNDQQASTIHEALRPSAAATPSPASTPSSNKKEKFSFLTPSVSPFAKLNTPKSAAKRMASPAVPAASPADSLAPSSGKRRRRKKSLLDKVSKQAPSPSAGERGGGNAKQSLFDLLQSFSSPF